MAIKSIYEIDVNDQSFRQFNQLFQQHVKTLNATPIAWRQVAQSQAQGVKLFKDYVREEAEAITKSRMINQAHEAALRLLTPQVTAWEKINRYMRAGVSTATDMTRELVKWSTITGAFTGLLGAGGLFGISRLAQGVATGRQSSMGLGVDYGQQKAFSTNFGRLVDPNAFLGGVNQSLTDVTKRVSLYNAGLGEKDLQGGAAAVGSRLLGRIKTLADQTPNNLLGNVFSARGLDQFMTAEQFQRLKNTSRGELNSLTAGFGRDTGAMGVGSADQRAYQDFVTQLDRAGTKIEAVFVRGLAPLADPLAKLSDAVAETLKAFLEGPKLKEWIKAAGEGIRTFADYVGTDDFQNKVKNFVWAIGVIADRTIAVATWMGGKTASVVGGTASAIGGTITDPGAAYGFNMKPGAGDVSPGMGALAKRLSYNVPEIDRFTAFNDPYHKGTGSAHEDDRAFDLTIKDPSQSAVIAAKVRAEMARMGISGRVIDEYANPSSRATGGHLHVQTDQKVDISVTNSAGSNIVVSAKQIGIGHK